MQTTCSTCFMREFLTQATQSSLSSSSVYDVGAEREKGFKKWVGCRDFRRLRTLNQAPAKSLGMHPSKHQFATHRLIIHSRVYLIMILWITTGSETVFDYRFGLWCQNRKLGPTDPHCYHCINQPTNQIRCYITNWRGEAIPILKAPITI